MAELVVQEQWRYLQERLIGYRGGEQHGHRIYSREERCIDRKNPPKPTQDLRTKLKSVQADITPAYQGGDLAICRRLCHNATILGLLASAPGLNQRLMPRHVRPPGRGDGWRGQAGEAVPVGLGHGTGTRPS